ncbi:YibE/F family protein [Jonesia quinghaiensis]|uniref:YibE/F family protein n=1 Tax=Jonesia quinghaiensis TaxID=262806 RepID=UPI0004082BB9|nr:YibE/F family protein [Jonesia quinghaiensis]
MTTPTPGDNTPLQFPNVPFTTDERPQPEPPAVPADEFSIATTQFHGTARRPVHAPGARTYSRPPADEAGNPIQPPNQGGHSHGGHSHAHGPAPRASTRVRITLAVLLVPMLLLALGGMVVLWPSDAPERGTVVTMADPDAVRTGTATGPVTADNLVPLQLDEEYGSEDVFVMVGPEYADAGIKAGDRMRIQYIPEAEASGSAYVFQDFERGKPIGALTVFYCILVVLVARWRGFASIIGLVVSFGVVVLFTLPALLVGTDPLATALITSIVVMFVVLYVAHGFTARTSTALLGTIIGLVLTTLLANWAVQTTNIVMLDEYLVQLGMMEPRVSMRAVVLCGVVLAGLGVLNDVTITQASAVWELKTVNPALGVWELFSRGMRIGRDHIASTVYTITFAYLGAALPLLLIVSLVDQSVWVTLTAGEIAVEVVRTLVGSIGLVLAIPITTMLGALALTVGHQEEAATEREAANAHA